MSRLMSQQVHRGRVRNRWQYTGPLWSDRTRCVGPARERWKVVRCDLGLVGLGRVHFTWGVVFAAEALSAALPKVTLVLADHDSAPTALFETAQLRRLAAQALSLH